MTETLSSLAWLPPAGSRSREPDPRTTQTSLKKRRPLVKSRASLSPMFTTRQRTISSSLSKTNPEEITREEEKHYPSYDAANPDHNPLLPQTTIGSQSLRDKASDSPKRSSLKRKQTWTKAPQRTISRLFQSLTGSMRAAAHYFHEAEDTCNDAENLVEDSDRSSGLFKTWDSAGPARIQPSVFYAPMAPSLMSIGISSTPLMSATSLDQASESEYESELEQRVASTQLTKPSDMDSNPLFADFHLSRSTVSAVPTIKPRAKAANCDPFVDTEAAVPELKPDEGVTSQPSYLHLGRQGYFTDEGRVASSERNVSCLQRSQAKRDENVSPMHGYTSDVESNSDVSKPIHVMRPFTQPHLLSTNPTFSRVPSRQPGSLSPFGTGEVQHAPSSPPFEAAKGATSLKAVSPNAKHMMVSLLARTVSDSYDADAEKSDLEPSMGPRKPWLDARADRQRRYQATMSGTSTDDDSDVGVKLTRSEDLQENKLGKDQIHINSSVGPETQVCTPAFRCIVADERVSPLALNRQTPSPVLVPLPKSEAFSKSYDIEETSRSPLSTSTSSHIEDIEPSETQCEAPGRNWEMDGMGQSNPSTSSTPQVDDIGHFQTASLVAWSTYGDKPNTCQDCDGSDASKSEQFLDPTSHLRPGQAQNELSDSLLSHQNSSTPAVTLQDELAGIGHQECYAHSSTLSREASETECAMKGGGISSPSDIGEISAMETSQTLCDNSTSEMAEIELVDALMRAGVSQANVRNILSEARGEDTDESDQDSDIDSVTKIV